MRLTAALFTLSLFTAAQPAFALDTMVPPAGSAILPLPTEKAAAPISPIPSVTPENLEPAPTPGVQATGLQAADEDGDLEFSSVRVAAAPTGKKSAEEKSSRSVCESLTLAALKHDLPILFFTRLIWQESRFDRHARSHAGAQGIAQFMPRTAAEMGLDDPFDPRQALPMSARFLQQLYRQFGNWGLAAAAYNGGARRVREWIEKKGKLPKETRDYVFKITGLSAERWANATPENVEFKLPPRVPCEDLPETETLVAAAGPVPVPVPPTRPQTAVAEKEASDDAPTSVSAAKRQDRKKPRKKATTERSPKKARGQKEARDVRSSSRAERKPAATSKKSAGKEATRKQAETAPKKRAAAKSCSGRKGGACVASRK